MRLSILLTSHHRLLSVAAMLDVFQSVNRYFEEAGKAPFFDIQLLYGEKEQYKLNYSGFVTKPITEVQRTDLVFIPAFASEDIKTLITENRDIILWLHGQYKQGVEIASFCTGAFLLGASGLLNGRKATTHINATTAFANSFPNVLLQAREILTEDGGVYTSGGATNSFHLMLHLIKKYCGIETAIYISKMFAIDMDREQQACYGTFTPNRDHGDELVKGIEQYIHEMYPEIHTIEEIVSEVPASRRNMVRRFKKATGVTPIVYLQKIRMEAAKKMLEQTNKSIMEVMLEVGYRDEKSFRKLFKKNAGTTPVAYREKFKGVVLNA